MRRSTLSRHQRRTSWSSRTKKTGISTTRTRWISLHLMVRTRIRIKQRRAGWQRENMIINMWSYKMDDGSCFKLVDRCIEIQIWKVGFGAVASCITMSSIGVSKSRRILSGEMTGQVYLRKLQLSRSRSPSSIADYCRLAASNHSCSRERVDDWTLERKKVGQGQRARMT
jgi:hypothetical protein